MFAQQVCTFIQAVISEHIPAFDSRNHRCLLRTKTVGLVQIELIESNACVPHFRCIDGKRLGRRDEAQVSRSEIVTLRGLFGLYSGLTATSCLT